MKIQEKAKSIELRKQGWSLKDISKELNVSKSSVSTWTRNIKLTEDQKNNLNERSKRYGNKNGQYLKHLSIRKKFQEKGKRQIRKNKNDYLVGCMLYWAEGSKRNNLNRVEFANSDPYMIKIFIGFLLNNFNVKKKEILISINCYLNNGVSKNEIENYWLNLTGLDKTSLRKMQINKLPSSSKGYRKNILKYGTCHLSVNRTDILQEIYGAIQEYCGFENKEWLGEILE